MKLAQGGSYGTRESACHPLPPSVPDPPNPHNYKSNGRWSRSGKTGCSSPEPPGTPSTRFSSPGLRQKGKSARMRRGMGHFWEGLSSRP